MSASRVSCVVTAGYSEPIKGGPMRTSSAFCTLLLLVPLTCSDKTPGTVGVVATHAAGSAGPGEAGQAHVRKAYGTLPMSFDVNEGQAHEEVKFLSRANGYSLFLTSTEAVLALRRPTRRDMSQKGLGRRMGVPAEAVESPSAVLRMRLAGARRPVEVKGIDPLPGRSHYFIGKDPRRWRTGVATYAGVRFTNVYDGVDLIYHGNQGQLEYDFVVAPGADANAIRVVFPGVDTPQVDTNGDLLFVLEGIQMHQRKPVVYQEEAGVRREIAGGYVLDAAGEVGFRVAKYDTSRPLVIDPVLIYSTYLGGSGGECGFGNGSIAVDASGSAYVAGCTPSTDFPTTSGSFQTTYGGGDVDAFVSKLNPEGSALVYSTYLGGSLSDAVDDLAIDASDSVYLTGYTISPDFPTTPGALDRTSANAAFVTKLSPSGSALVYSTRFPVDGFLTVDNAGNAYVLGAGGPGLPVTPGALQPAYGGGQLDGYVAKLDPTGSALLYSTFLGGSGDESPSDMAGDSSGVYIVGRTTSSDFPTTAGAFQRTCPFYPFSGGCFTAFASKIDAGGSALAYSTYLGAVSDPRDVAVGLSGEAYVTGITHGTFPTTPGAFQTTYGGGGDDAFVTKLNATGTALVYSTYLGGRSWDGAEGIAVDAAGDAHVAGWTWSPDFPVANEVQPALRGEADAFVTKINSAGSAPIYSTYLGGSGAESAQSVAVDPAGSTYVMGGTQSTDFPTVNAIQGDFGGGSYGDYFVAKIAEEPSCPGDVTDQVNISRSRFYGIPFTPFRLQWVVIRNNTTDPIQGPLAYVLEDLQNATLLGTRLKTVCFSPSGDPFLVIHAGRDEVLNPEERVLGFLLFFRTHPGPITYTPRVLSGIPTQ
jgi:hypothetical protein